MMWMKSKIREYIIIAQMHWFRFTGEWIKEGFCICKLAVIYSLGENN
jgi:hypothetical protein